MNKRKIDINDLKKISIRGATYRTVHVKETLLTYFKKNQARDLDIFKVSFPDLAQDLLNQMSALELAYKIQQGLQEPLKFLQSQGNQFKLQAFNLKKVPTEYPIAEIAQCLYLKKDETTTKLTLNISKNKLWLFFKNLRVIYSQFCNSVGDKFILQKYEYKKFYQNFQLQWTKNEQKGKISCVEKAVKKVCRSFYFLGVLIQNNIFSYIDDRERKKQQQSLQVGTRSDNERNLKALNQQVSSTYSFGSNDFLSSYNHSNFSIKLKSQKSNDDDFIERVQRNLNGGYSQKSLKVERRKPKGSCWLLENSEINCKDLKFQVFSKQDRSDEINRFQNTNKNISQINLLSNDVQNLLIEKAFEIQKVRDNHFIQDEWERGYNQNLIYSKMNTNNGYNSMNWTNSMGYVPPAQHSIPSPAYDYRGYILQQYSVQPNSHSDDLLQMRRSVDCINWPDNKKVSGGFARIQSKDLN